jgi:hypothetical protein
MDQERKLYMVLYFIKIYVCFLLVHGLWTTIKEKPTVALTLSLPVSDPSYVTLCTWRHPWVTTRLFPERYYTSASLLMLSYNAYGDILWKIQVACGMTTVFIILMFCDVYIPWIALIKMIGRSENNLFADLTTVKMDIWSMYFEIKFISIVMGLSVLNQALTNLNVQVSYSWDK